MRNEKFPGGLVVAGCFISLTTTSGLSFYGLAVYLNAFSKERGWSLSSISLATTIFFITGGFVGLLVSRLIAKYDVRRIMVGGAILGAIALALLGHSRAQWQLYLIYVLFAFGFTGAGLIPATTVVTRWYNARRSVALSIASTGLSVGGMVITPIAKWLTDQLGLATATPILAGIWLIGTVPFIIWLIKPDPIALEWLPDGGRVQQDTVVPPPTGMPFADAVRTRYFRCITFGYVLSMGAQVGGLQQLVKLAEERTGAVAAAFATLIVAGMSVIARLVGGRVIMRMPMTGFTASLAAIQGASLIAMAYSYHAWAFYATLIIFGATVGNLLMLQSLIISHQFGVLDYPRLFSRLQLVVVIGTAGGPFLLGWLYDQAGNYQLSYAVAGVISLLGAALMALGGPAHGHEATVAAALDPAQSAVALPTDLARSPRGFLRRNGS